MTLCTLRWRVLSLALPSSMTRLKKVPMVKSLSALLQGLWCNKYLKTDNKPRLNNCWATAQHQDASACVETSACQ